MAQQRPHDEQKAQKMQSLLGLPQNKPEPPKEEAPKEEAPVSPPPPPPQEPDNADSEDAENGSKLRWDKEKFLRGLWTVASVISMTVTVVVLIVVVLLFGYARQFPLKEIAALIEEKSDPLPPDFGFDDVVTATEKTVETMPEEVGLNTPVDLLQGLYDNFELMDEAHIKTTILVEDEIPVQFTLALNEDTTVILSEPVTIPGARVALTTGGLNIFNAPATVTLPEGTELPISLALEVPVDEMIPVTLNVPVDIALNETDLHEPFVGLQDVVRPLYCLIKSDAMNKKGQFICSQKTVE